MLRKTVVEIISVGNELLMGKILNTNAQWVAEKVTSYGGVVRRITTIQDNIGEISDSVKEALSRKPDWVIISGGLGPTYDDKTLEGVAKAFGRRLVVDEDALLMVKDRYIKLVEQGIVEKVELTPSQVKMATLPEGTQPLRNRVGTAPGVLIVVDGVEIVCLPGVPSELKAIFMDSVMSRIEQRIGLVYRRERLMEIVNVPESTLAPYLKSILRKNPRLYIKSHPKTIEGGVLKLGVHIAFTGKTLEQTERVLDEVSKTVMEIAKEAKGEARFTSH